MVNLLPWRERSRQGKRRRFLSILATSVILSLALLLAIDRQMAGSMAVRLSENQRLRTQIGLLGERGEEAGRLLREQENAALHMQALNSLQLSRPVPAAVLSELFTHLPAAAYFRSLERKGNNLQLEGVAESHAAIAELMRNLASSPWFPDVQLDDVSGENGDEAANPGLYSFSLSLRIDSPGS